MKKDQFKLEGMGREMSGIRIGRVSAPLMLAVLSAAAIVGLDSRAVAQEDAGQQAKHAAELALVIPDGNGPEIPEANQKVTLELIAADAEIVKGKPYSADTSTETVQTLSDGNRIVHRTVSKFYRDNEGRTRREETFGNIDPAHPAPHEVKVFIDDPVAETAYVLDPGSKTAEKVRRSPRFLSERNSDDDGTQVMFKSVAESEQLGQPGHPGRMMINFKDDHSQGPLAMIVQDMNDNRSETKEDLGVQSVAGVDCNGTRRTITIPAGSIGNEKPIEIVTETWFAQSIGAVVLSTTNDPRFGQTTYKLDNLQTADPSPNLFAPPPGFAVSRK